MSISMGMNISFTKKNVTCIEYKTDSQAQTDRLTLKTKCISMSMAMSMTVSISVRL